MLKRLPDLRIILGAYALLTLVAALVWPVSVDEILRLIGSSQSSFGQVLTWARQVPGGAPLGDFIQFCIMAVIGHSRLAVRLPSLACAVASCHLMWKLARQAAVQQPLLAVLLFMLLPLQVRYAADARPFELGLLLLISATIYYLRLLAAPNLRNSAVYSLLLLGCLYTEPFAYLPAVGYLLFLLAFIARADKRRAFWYALPSTVIPVLLFLPYFFWSTPFVNPRWLFNHDHVPFSETIYLDVMHAVGGGGTTAYVLSAILIAAAVVACWRSFQLTDAAFSKRMALFCLFGGVLSTVTIALIIDGTYNVFFSPDQIVWIAPALCILMVATLDWLQQKSALAGLSVAALVLLLCVYKNAEYMVTPKENIRAIEDKVRPLLSSDSCVVFVSQGLSRSVLTYLDPELGSKECFHFFHTRVVLASHPYVRPDQQEDAESFFRGLNFSISKRMDVGQGTIVVMDQRQ